MTERQIEFQINKAIEKCDFSEWDFVYQLSALCDDYEAGDIVEDDLKSEVKEILSNEFGLFGEFLAKSLLEAILDD